MNIPLPYNLTEDQLLIEDVAEDSSMDDEMDWLNDHVSWSDEPAMERIFRSTVLLHHKTKRPLGECLRTALIWEMG